MVQRMKNKHLLATAALVLSCSPESRTCCNAFSIQSNSKRPFSSISSASSSPSAPLMTRSSRTSSMTLGMESSWEQEGSSRLQSSNSRVESLLKGNMNGSKMENLPSLASIQEFVMPVFWTSLLITSNTVGAGMLVLPELCEGPGMGLSMALFLGMYVLNLVSGLFIAEVAVTQKERSGEDAPSSFKAFAEANLDSPIAKDVIATVSVVKNALVLAFGTMKAGHLGHDVLGWNADAISVAWALVFAAVLGTQSAPRLSKVASVFVAGLFTSFATILIPGLAQMDTSMMEVMNQPGTSADPIGDMIHVAPIILMSFIFQNIVPTTARILDYDRTKIALSMSIGTLFPFAMYAIWCLAVLGGGVDTAVGLDGPMFTLFSVVTIAGSHLGSSTSMAEELDTYLRPSADENASLTEASIEGDRKNEVFSWASVLITAALAIGLGEGFAGNLNDLLSLAGAYGSPFLYVVLPLVMAWTQKKQASASEPQPIDKELPASQNPILSNIPLAITASAATGFVGTEVFHLL